MATDAFETLVAESKSVGWPTCYRDDLYVHDRSALEENKPVKFVWLLRECGTDLCMPDSLLGFSVLSYNARYNNMISDRRVYIYDRGQLRDATYQQAWDFLYAASHKCIREYVGNVADAKYSAYKWRTTNWEDVYKQLDRERFAASYARCKNTLSIVESEVYEDGYVIATDESRSNGPRM